MDFNALRAEAIALLGKLSGAQWSDFNVHDPGITILEQICYAITDLAYRSNHSIQDLIASSSATPCLPPSDQIRSGDPITQADHEAAIRAAGARIVRIASDPSMPFPLFFYEGSITENIVGAGDLRLEPRPGDLNRKPLSLRGIDKIHVYPYDPNDADTLIERLSNHLHGRRLLCADFDVSRLVPRTVWVNAELDVVSVGQPVALLVQILKCIDEALFSCISLGSSDNIRLSDLLHALLDLDEVRAVIRLRISLSDLSGTSSPLSPDPWVFSIPAGEVPQITRDTTSIRLLNEGVPVPINQTEFMKAAFDAWHAIRSASDAASAPSIPPTAPRGRRRDLTTFPSLRRQLPEVYGVGPFGLRRGALPERQAQTLQLEAYLFLFDQLLTNSLAQLALAPELLSCDSSAAPDQERSYAAQPAEDPCFDTSHLRSRDSTDYAKWLLTEAIEPDPTGQQAQQDRRERFLAHLLARFGEELNTPLANLPAARRAYLRDIVRLTGARGSGIDILAPSSTSGFDERFRRKLGLLDPPAEPSFLLIEHILLRPIPEDSNQAVEDDAPSIPFLAGVTSQDPWSLQVSLVIRQSSMDGATEEDRVVQILLAELPAHLTPHIWFADDRDGNHWSQIQQAWINFRGHLAAYRNPPSEPDPQDLPLHLRVRDARDRLIELLELGFPWPLRDLPIDAPPMVASGEKATITLAFSQTGVRYELWDCATGKQALDPNPIQAEGDSTRPIELHSPPVMGDVIFRIRAVKTDTDTSLYTKERATWLRGEIRVLEGIDTTLPVRFIGNGLRVLDNQTGATLSHYDTSVAVEVQKSQRGIRYYLIDHKDRMNPSAEQLSMEIVPGTESTITLQLPAHRVREDLDLRVKALRAVPQQGQPNENFLDPVLPLRVTANPDLLTRIQCPNGSYGSILPYGQVGHFEIGQTSSPSQSGVIYHLWGHHLDDDAFLFRTDPPVPSVEIKDDSRSILIKVPALPVEPIDAVAPPPFDVSGPVTAGSGAMLPIDLGGAIVDTLWLVIATKQHRLHPLDSADGAVTTSSIRLEGYTPQLVRPNPFILLRMVLLQQNDTTSLWQVFGGEAGVLYDLFDTSQGQRPLGRVYFHRQSLTDNRMPKGIGELRVEVDFVITSSALQGSPFHSQDPLHSPIVSLAISAADLNTSFSPLVTATRLITGLKDHLQNLPLSIRVDPMILPSPGTAEIIVATVVGEMYTLTLNGVPIGNALAGTGSTLRFSTGPLQHTTTFTLVIATRDTPGKEIHLPITVPVAEG